MKALPLAIFSLFFSLPVSAQEDQHNMYRGSVGLGGGMLYGFDSGLRADYRVAEQVTANIGIGFNNSTPILGMQFHIRPQHKLWQPRVGLHYGVVDSLDASLPVNGSSNTYYQKTYLFKGFALEAGQSFNFGASRRHGLDLTFTLRLGSDKKKKKREELGLGEGWFESIDQTFDSINVGYRYNY
jgi:hypothetical protein